LVHLNKRMTKKKVTKKTKMIKKKKRKSKSLQGSLLFSHISNLNMTERWLLKTKSPHKEELMVMLLPMKSLIICLVVEPRRRKAQMIKRMIRTRQRPRILLLNS